LIIDVQLHLPADRALIQINDGITKEGREKRLAAEAFPPLDQLASLCASHHNAKTNAEQRGEDYMRKGCDIIGRPNDLDHPWNKDRGPRSGF
jgi:hypothetical protein